MPLHVSMRLSIRHKKENRHYSLHTVVLGDDGFPVEVQILISFLTPCALRFHGERLHALLIILHRPHGAHQAAKRACAFFPMYNYTAMQAVDMAAFRPGLLELSHGSCQAPGVPQNAMSRSCCGQTADTPEGRGLKIEAAEAMVRRGLLWAHGKLVLHARRAEGPHGASTLAAELARHGGWWRCLARLQHGHRGVEARLLQEAGKVSRDLSRGKWHHLTGVKGPEAHRNIADSMRTAGFLHALYP